MKKVITYTFEPEEVKQILGHNVVQNFDEFVVEDSDLTVELCETKLKKYVTENILKEELPLTVRFYSKAASSLFRSNQLLYAKVRATYPDVII